MILFTGPANGTYMYFELDDLLLTVSSAFSGMMNSIWSSRTSAVNLTESNPAFYNYKSIGLYTVNIFVIKIAH